MDLKSLLTLILYWVEGFGITTLENHLAISTIAEYLNTCDPALAHLGIDPGEMRTYVH